MATMPVREQSARRFLGIAATLAVAGVLFNLNSEDQTMPKVLALVAVVTLVWSLHRFGRLGPDESIVFEELEPAAPKKKKKKKKRAASAQDTETNPPPSDAAG